TPSDEHSGDTQEAVDTQDAVDADGDGATSDVDCDDDGCSGSPDCSEANTPGGCDDGADNDQDGLFDCDDPDCATDPACGDGIEGNDAGECEDGIDNDGDGLTDCQDEDCAGFDGCDDYEGDEPGECTDGVDNDSDGDTDCADEGCAGSPDCEAGSDLGSEGNPGESCDAILTGLPDSTDGSFWVSPGGAEAFEVYCDMSTNGGGCALFAYHTDTAYLTERDPVVAWEETGVLPDASWQALRDEASVEMMFIDEHERMSTLSRANFDAASCVTVSSISSLLSPTSAGASNVIWHDENEGCDIEDVDYSYVTLSDKNSDRAFIVERADLGFDEWGYGSEATSQHDQDELLYYIK
ncbi:MAG: hypothetical protein GY884_24920, partial [Proteobacteria bacterium]|nr:hypothetical protein [Pseudomonadota bacterium]